MFPYWKINPDPLLLGSPISYTVELKLLRRQTLIFPYLTQCKVNYITVTLSEVLPKIFRRNDHITSYLTLQIVIFRYIDFNRYKFMIFLSFQIQVFLSIVMEILNFIAAMLKRHWMRFKSYENYTSHNCFNYIFSILL